MSSNDNEYVENDTDSNASDMDTPCVVKSQNTSETVDRNGDTGVKNKEDRTSWLQRRIEKLVRHYDVTSMAYFIIVECHGNDGRVDAGYAGSRRKQWGTFLKRVQACRLDFSKREVVSLLYDDFVNNVKKDVQSETFGLALSLLFHIKGAVDSFRLVSLNHSWNDVAETFPGHMVKSVEKKIETWFDKFEVISVKLSGNVRVSDYIRVVDGVIDAFAIKNNQTYLLAFKSSELDTPQPTDLVRLCLFNMLAIQNGLDKAVNDDHKTEASLPHAGQSSTSQESQNSVRLGLLILHINAKKPILRLWEYTPTVEVKKAIREHNVDALIGTRDAWNDFSSNLVEDD